MTEFQPAAPAPSVLHTAVRQRHRRTLAALLMAVGSLFLLLLFSRQVVRRVDLSMREDVLGQARMLAQAVDERTLRRLSGTENDLQSEDYARIKEQLAAIASANPRCRFLYLLGRSPDGMLFFFADSVPEGHPDEAPAGMAYDNAPSSFGRIFETGEPVVEGPYADQWGTFVTAAVPIVSRDSPSTLAVLGMDFDARTWNVALASSSATPIGLAALMLGIALASLYAFMPRIDASPRLVAARLMLPLSLLIVVLLFIPLALLLNMHRRQLAEVFANQAKRVANELRVDLSNQADGLALAATPIAGDPQLALALRQRDTQSLREVWAPVFMEFRQRHRVSCFSFSDAANSLMACIDNPNRSGGRLEGTVADAAMRKHAPAAGTELGPDGVFRLSAIHPVFDGAEVVGHLQLGKGVEDVLDALAERVGVDLSLVLFKRHLDRSLWEERLRQSGDTPRWDRFPHAVLAYNPSGRFPDTLIEQALHPRDHGGTQGTLRIDGGHWRFLVLPIRDSSGLTVGSLVVKSDVSDENKAFAHMLVLGSTTAGVLVAILLAFVYALLHRTDVGVRAQQEVLRHSEERNRAIIDLLPDIVIQTNADGVYLDVLASSEERLYLPKKDLIGKKIADLLPREEAASIMAAIRETLRTRSLQTVEYVLEVPAGRVHFEARIVPSGTDVAMVLVRDVSERAKMELALRESEELFKSLVSNIPGVFYRRKLDRRRSLLYVSPDISSLCGYPAEDFTATRTRTLDGLVHPDDSAQTAESIKRAIEANAPWSIEYRILHRDGEIRWIHETGRAVVYRAGAVLYLFQDGFLRDATQSKRMEAERLEMQMQLLQTGKLEAVGQLAAGVAHEINTPIQFVGDNAVFLRNSFDDLLRFVETLRRLLREAAAGKDSTEGIAEMERLASQIDLPFLADEIPRAVNDAIEGIQRVRRIVSAMRDFSHPDSTDKTMADLNAGIENTVLICRSEWKNVAEIRLDLDPHLPKVLCHPGAINQVLVNLIVNAAHAIRAAQASEPERKGLIAIRTRAESRCVFIHVEDNGSGVPEHIRNRLFEPFFTTKEVGKGTGQGLYVARNIVLKDHGGQIEFSSKLGEGTMFTVTLPLRQTTRE